MVFVLHSPIVNPRRLERVHTYFNIYTKLDVIPSRNMKLLSGIDKI